MSNMFNERCALTKLRAELEEREGRFGHFTWKYRSGEEQEKKVVRGNRFKVLKSWIMQCGVREVRRQEIVREEVRSFGCGKKGHKR